MSEQIKETDIMIGNYITDIHSPKGFFKVTEIRKKTVLYGFDYRARYEDLCPIPLTEDILLKCGGTKKEHITLELTKGRKLLFTTRHTKYHQVFLLHDDDMIALSMDKIYLHQLQNLFKSLTGNELEVNL